MRPDRPATIADPTGPTAALERNYAGSTAPKFSAPTRFFRAFAEVPADGRVQEEFARLGREAGIELVGPPLSYARGKPGWTPSSASHGS
jgi:hypothetical protein